MKNTVEINIETLTKQVNEGMKKPELATFYGLPVTQMGKALKDAGLKIRKFHAPAFVLVTGETEETKAEEVATEDIKNDVVVGEVSDSQVPSGDADATPEVTWKN